MDDIQLDVNYLLDEMAKQNADLQKQNVILKGQIKTLQEELSNKPEVITEDENN